MNPDTNESTGFEPLRRLGHARPPAGVEDRIVRGAFARMERRTARRWQPMAWAAVAAASAAALFLVARPGPEVELRPGSVLAAEAMPRTFALGDHEVVVSPAGRLVVERFAGNGAELRLEAGAARFEVEPLEGGERFRVVTGRATVEVVGTRFTVSDDGACTRVAVERGKVRALGHHDKGSLLGAGESALFCGDGAPIELALPGEASVREAIRLLSEGRDLERAASLLSDYRARFPEGVFQEEALYNLCRIEAQLGHADSAAGLAEEFLARFPASARAERLHTWCKPGL